MFQRRGLVLLGLVAIVLVLAVPSLATFYTDWLWFRETGYGSVFLRTILAENWLFLATFAVVFGVLWLNLRIARGQRSGAAMPIRGPRASVRALPLQGITPTGWITPAAAIVAALIAMASTGDWLTWLSFFHRTPFGTQDPLFHRDVSFYVFTLPVYQTIRSQALLVAWLALIGCGLIYVLSGSFVFEPRYGMAFWPRMRLTTGARRHLGVLGAAIFGLLAWSAWLDTFDLLLTQGASLFGAGYSDVYARLPFLHITTGVLIVGAMLSIAHGFNRRGWMLPVAIGAYVVVSMSGGLYATIVQNFIVAPNGPDREQPYILNHIAATRQAYGLNNVEERDFEGDQPLSVQDIAKNVDTLDNVRLWDHQPLLQTFGQIQEMRTYYEFVNVDNDRYLINGKMRQVMLSVRELNTDNLKTRSWVNEHLAYTHGYGLTLGPVNQVTTGGLPVLFVQNLPPVSTVNLPVDEAGIYFGEIPLNYAIVGTRSPEFHYPRGSDNEMTRYSGAAGVPIGTLARRMLFALRFWTSDILVTNQITPDSRILFNRQIAARVQLIAPFLTPDADPYPVLSGGRIYWIQDAYTSSANYPYSAPTHTQDGDLNYIRNSVKIVIDAYNGTTTCYLADPGDPIVQTISKIFPGMLHPLDEMPPGLRQHVRYPEDLFKIQAGIFSTFHMTNPQVFYLREDQWEMPALDDSTTARMQPYYTMMKLPGDKQAEFIQMLPFTPRVKPNLSAWLAARSDGAHYGHLLVFRFPKQKTIYGPQQVIGFINQDQNISPAITLWNQQGSKVVWGTLLVIPIEQSLLYVRPLYLQSAQGRIPELKRVIVSYQNQIVMAETFRTAMIQLFGHDVANILPLDQLASNATSVVQSTPATSDTLTKPVSDEPQSLEELAAEAQSHLDKADKAQREGDWAKYGDEMKSLKDVVAKMNKIKK